MCKNFFSLFFGKKEEEPQQVETNQENEIIVNEPIENEYENAIDEDIDDYDDVEEEIEEVIDENLGEGQISEKAKKIKILIDNGHGYNTAGKKSPYSCYGVKPEIEFYEYKWNREIAKPICDQLVAKGYNAEILVPEDYDVSLTERYNRVNKYCAQLGTSNVILISIHANAAGNGKEWKSAQGWCAFTSKGTTKSDKIAEFLYDEAEKNFKGRKIRKDMSDGDRDWEANFAMTYKTYCPAVLTENFFYDNVDDVKYILSQEGRDAVIKTHVDGIINYLNSI